MELQVILLITVLCGLIFIFRVQAKHMEQKHQTRIAALQQLMGVNQGQIQLRQNNLGRYDFQKYNLDAVLIVQCEIKLTA